MIHEWIATAIGPDGNEASFGCQVEGCSGVVTCFFCKADNWCDATECFCCDAAIVRL